jgi:sterol 3beta-glucosyltransferase
MASEGRQKAQEGKKLAFSRASMDLPEHLKHGADEEDDVTQPQGKNKEQYMHQSIFSMITAAGHHGKRADFISRFDEDPSESEEDEEDNRGQPRPSGPTAPSGSGKLRTEKPAAQDPSRRKSRLLKSLSGLDRVRPRKDKRRASPDPMSSSQILPPSSDWKYEHTEDTSEPETSSEAPVLSRMLTARAEMEAAEPAPATQKAKEDVAVATNAVASPVSLAEQLAEIFAFDEAEKVVCEYPCWLLQTVLLQGYMYITQKHVCFYAYLPKKDVSIEYTKIHQL